MNLNNTRIRTQPIIRINIRFVYWARRTIYYIPYKIKKSTKQTMNKEDGIGYV